MNSELNEKVDGLLKIIDPKLVSNYEANVCIPKEMGTIKKMNEDYVKLGKLAKKYDRCMRFFLFSMMVSMFLMIISVVLQSSYEITANMISYAGICQFVLSLAITLYSGRKAGDFCKDQNKRHSLLKEFISSVEALDSPVGQTVARYDEVSVRNNILKYAMQIVYAERKLDRVRLQKQRNIHDMMHFSNWILKCQLDLQVAEESALLFGLSFDRATLFDEAQKHLE